MPGFRQIARSPFGQVLAVIIIAVLLVLSVPSSAQATPAIDKAKREAAALLELIEQLDAELGAAAEEYNYAKQRLDDIKVAAKRTSRELDQTKADMEEVQNRLNERVVSIYKAGNPGMLDVLFDAASFSQMLTRFNQLTRLGEQDAELLEKVQAYQAKMEDRKTKLDSQVREQKALTVELEAAKEKVEAQLKKQEKALKGKEAQVAKLKKEEAARQAKLAAEARARAAWLASRPGKVVSYAMQYLGVPYVWGGESPRGFDCSGLVKYVYAKVGISLPHSSRMQYNYGRYVSKGQVRAGDLVFFYNPIHHVGIYIGNGKMVDATGNKVQISNVFRASYFGAKRLL